MKLKITVHGVAYEVDVEILDDDTNYQTGPLPVYHPQDMPSSPLSPRPASLPPKPQGVKPVGGVGGNVTSPIAGTVLEIKCKVGDSIKEGDIVLILEAMKMKTSIAAPADGKVKNIPVSVQENIREGQTLVEFE